MKKLFVFLTLLALIAPQLVLADGMIIEPYPDRWDYALEDFQQAFINYEEGIEKMVISVGAEIDQEAVWIFPVPANPEDTVINIVTSLPQLRGEEINKMAKNSLEDIREGLLATQIYPFPFLMTLGASRIGYTDNLMAPTGLGWTQEKAYDVEVHEHLEKEGITTEIITAKTADGLYQYLKDKDLDIEQGSIPVLDNYIGQAYTFVVSWLTPDQSNELIILDEESETDIDDDEEVYPVPMSDIYMLKPQQIQKGIFVAFPTDQIYYPLLPTSVYESEIVPAVIRIFGFVEPNIFQSIKTYTEVEYYYDRSISLDKELEILYHGSLENVKYTKIEIQSPSKMLKDDLWIANQAPLETHLPLFIGQHPFVSWLLSFIKLSLLAGLLLGLVIYKEARTSWKGFLKTLLLGLFNCLTIIGLIFASLFVRFKEHQKDMTDTLVQLKQKGYVWKRRLALVLLIADIPFLVIGCFAMMNAFSRYLRYLEYDYSYSYLSDIWWYLLVFVVIPIAVLVFCFVIKHIKKEDRPLFEKLNQQDYSSWTLLPRDKRKFIFIPVYSIVFILLSLLVTYGLEGWL